MPYALQHDPNFLAVLPLHLHQNQLGEILPALPQAAEQLMDIPGSQRDPTVLLDQMRRQPGGNPVQQRQGQWDTDPTPVFFNDMDLHRLFHPDVYMGAARIIHLDQLAHRALLDHSNQRREIDFLQAL